VSVAMVVSYYGAGLLLPAFGAGWLVWWALRNAPRAAWLKESESHG